ncbi:MAG: type II toxin-antitoxin system HicA family toxin [Anaerolineales bacterium]|jgi:predicted RNA binding protein YcfA (HicA-like mRNA interferase family)|nr:type II toxin-antitoxin system HicA family toxin [Anaerolineales bacterium]
MGKLPSVSGWECIKALQKAGFEVKRQRGSHVVLRRANPLTQLTVPDHKELDRGTLRAILRSADISVDDFIALL